jgi:3-oxoacyl-[acyl-carrier protein] reductase
VAERLARDGLIVVINCLGSLARADALVRMIEDFGGMARAIRADVGDAGAVRRMFDDVERDFGGLDVLVNSAGVMQHSNVADCDEGMFDRHVTVNLKGTFNAMGEAARRIRRGGRIISVSSSVVDLYPPGYAMYAATNAGVEALTRVLSKELRGRDVTVNAVAPGPTAIELLLKTRSPAFIDQLANASPLERIGEPEDWRWSSPISRARMRAGSTAR